MPNKKKKTNYGNVSDIAAYNIANDTHFWRQDQVDADIAQRKRLQQSQQIYDSTADNPFSIGDDVRAAYISAGKRPEITADQARIDQFDADAKATNIAGLGTVAMLPLAGEFTTYGLLGGAARIGGGFAGSAAGSWGLGKAGDYADKKLGTNWIGNTGRVIGGLAGFVPGMNLGYKGTIKLASKSLSVARIRSASAFRNDVIGNAFDDGVKNTILEDGVIAKNILAGKLGWAPKQSKVLWHNSETPITKLDVNVPAWDIVKRDAPLGHVWTTGTETRQGFIGARPFHNRSVEPVTLSKPMVQLNESVGTGKNAVRNEILRFADQSGADAVNFSNIADNTLQNQDVYAVFKDIDVKPKLTEAERLGIPKGGILK